MEFFRSAPAAPLPSTLILPALSIGNVGQLAVDLLISSLEASRVGYLDDPNILPCVGNDPFGPHAEGSLALALEVYEDSENDITIVQQRSPVIKGTMTKYAVNLAEWIQQEHFKEVVIVSGLDSGKRERIETAGPISYISEGGVDEICKKLGWKKFEHFSLLSDDSALNLQSLRQVVEDPLFVSNEEQSIREYYSSMPFAALLSSLKARGLRVVSLLCYCSEGDNIPDAFLLANELHKYLQVLKTGEGQGHINWKVPLSWSTVYGPPPDQDLY